METDAIERVILNSESLKKWATQFEKKRFLFDKAVSIDCEYFVGITGLRGVGKTVLLLQLANQFKDSAYFSADYSYLSPYSLYDVVDSLRKQGFNNIFVDEIHSRPAWAEDVKTVYDEHNCRVLFSGSSSLKIKQKGTDLSRRVAFLDLKPVSFREYANIRKGTDIPVYSFGELLKKKRETALKHAKVREYFDEYLRFGGVLYSRQGFREALENSVEKIITSDLASLRSVNVKYETDAKRLLYHIAASTPYEFSYSSVSQKLGMPKSFLIKLLHDLEDIDLVKLVLPCGDKAKKEPKVFLSIPHRWLFSQRPDKGALREEFFVNHAPVEGYFKTKRGEKTPDFKVDGHVVEVGGPSKKQGQNADVVAVDGMRFDGSFAPLFLFGFLY